MTILNQLRPIQFALFCGDHIRQPQGWCRQNDRHGKHSGGTDMRKPLTYVEQYSPEVVMLLTDGHTPWPELATPFPLIVGCTTDAPCPDCAGVVRIEVQ
jgi:hypothetical protein